MKVDKMVPEIYYSGSRDFSFLGRLFETSLNYMKTGAEIVGSNLDSENINPFTLDLLCDTLGFTLKHKYITKDLVYIANVFTTLVRKKGSMDSIEDAIKALLSSQEITQDFDIDLDEDKILKIVLPETLKDVVLLEDLFDYILPAGVLYEISYAGIKEETESEPLYYEDSVVYVKALNANTGRIYNGDKKLINYQNIPDQADYSSSDYERAITPIGTIVTSLEENESQQNNN